MALGESPLVTTKYHHPLPNETIVLLLPLRPRSSLALIGRAKDAKVLGRMFSYLVDDPTK
jgi:hypothetical protein